MSDSHRAGDEAAIRLIRAVAAAASLLKLIRSFRDCFRGFQSLVTYGRKRIASFGFNYSKAASS